MPERFFFDQDMSCHWYLVPASKREAWNEWTELDEDDDAWEPPSFEKRLDGHPNGMTFEKPGESGEW